MNIDVPLTEQLTQELVEFWTGIFGGPGDVKRGMLLGDELEHNRHTLYMEKRDERLAGTCHLTMPLKLPILAGFGEVATDPEFRRSGTATRVCGAAVEDFRSRSGEALFLSGGEPGPARIYHRLGWRRLANSHVMANITSGDSPEAFLVDYFRDRGEASVVPMTPEFRVQMIPLIVAPHDWQILDANVNMASTRHRVQNYCMSLYPRYEKVVGEGHGAWFVARTGHGRAVGLATVRLDDETGCQVDGFTHGYYLDIWDDLLHAAIDWGTASGAAKSWASVSVEDEQKRSLFERLGFSEVGPSVDFELDGRSVGALRLEKRTER